MESAVLPADQAVLLGTLQAWRTRERHLERKQAYLRRMHVTGWRRDMYRQAAAWLGRGRERDRRRLVAHDPDPPGR
jgi:hypothetical protein